MSDRLTPAAAKKRAQRRRARLGKRVLRVEVHEGSLVEGLLRAGLIGELAALEPRNVDRAAAAVLAAWAQQWRGR